MADFLSAAGEDVWTMEDGAAESAALDHAFAMGHVIGQSSLSQPHHRASLLSIVEDAPIAEPFLVWSAALRGDIDALNLAVESSAPGWDEPGPRGWSVLYAAATRGHVKAVASLLRRGAQRNAQVPGTGWTALMTAAQQGFLDRSSLQRVADATRREVVDCPFVEDECTLLHLGQRDECERALTYSQLIQADLAKVEALVACDQFWSAVGDGEINGQPPQPTASIKSPSDVPTCVRRRCAEATQRAERAEAFKDFAESEWRSRLRA